MMSEHQIDEVRVRKVPDRATKDAMVELGSFVAGAIEDELTDITGTPVRVTAIGCQGVREGIRPALEYSDGDELWIIRAHCSIGDWDAADWVLMLPQLSALFPAAAVLEADTQESATAGAA